MLPENRLSNDTKDVVPQCKIVYYAWYKNDLGSDSLDAQLSAAASWDISSQIISCSFNKNNSGPSGSFSLTLSNSPGILSGDWKDILKRGSWLAIYMAKDGNLALAPKVGAPLVSGGPELKYLRSIARIDRTSVRNVTNEETGALETTFIVSGRDFGCIYEDADIWHNFFYTEQAVVQSLAESVLNVLGDKPLDAVLNKMHDLMFYPKALGALVDQKTQSITTTALQWLLPDALVRDIYGLSGAYYWGSLPVKDFFPTEATLAVSAPTDFLWGSAWSNLKQISVPELHELFTELSDAGDPRLIFRPIPFALDKLRYPKLQSVTLYRDLPTITIPAIDIISTDLGEDDQNRYNSFLVSIASSLIGQEDNVAWLKDTRFPFHIQDSIKRHGFRPMHITVNTIVSNGAQADGKANPELLRQYNELVYDYWYASIFSESGTIECEGSNEVRLGKCISLAEDVPYAYGRRYYIEGYADTFIVQENGACTWTQQIQVTRGFSETDLKTKRFQERSSDFNIAGEFTA